jgi:hypothetical protein
MSIQKKSSFHTIIFRVQVKPVLFTHGSISTQHLIIKCPRRLGVRRIYYLSRRPQPHKVRPVALYSKFCRKYRSRKTLATVFPPASSLNEKLPRPQRRRRLARQPAGVLHMRVPAGLPAEKLFQAALFCRDHPLSRSTWYNSKAAVLLTGRDHGLRITIGVRCCALLVPIRMLLGLT